MEIWQVILGSIAIVVIVFMSISLTGFFTPLYGWLRGEELKPETQEEAENRFNIFISNIKACGDKADTNCLCEGFPNWPGTFPTKSIVTIKHTGEEVEINLSHNKKVLKSESIKGIKIGAINRNQENVPFGSEKSIDFDSKLPRYIQLPEIKRRWRGSKAVISSYFYKTKNEIKFILGKKEEKAEEIENLPKCS